MRKVIFIQARVGSSRLPYKVLQYVGEKTVLGHVIEAAKASGVGDVYVLTSNEPGDSLTVSEATRCETNFFRHAGSEHDVLARFCAASHGLGLGENNAIIRICADSPLIKPETIKRIADAIQPGDDVATFTIGNVPATLVGCGSVAEAVRVGALRELIQTNPTEEESEHVTIGLYKRDGFKIRGIPMEPPTEKESVDTLEDLQRIRRRFENGTITDVIPGVEESPGKERTTEETGIVHPVAKQPNKPRRKYVRRSGNRTKP